MKWNKKGLIYNTCGKFGFDYSHCHKPTAIQIDSSTVRLYFGVRDKANRTRTTYIDLNKDNLSDIQYIHQKPVLDLGKIGTFDDCGAQVCSVIKHEDCIYMYYIGWNTSTTVPSRNSLGLAISYDNGASFVKVYEGPILERYKNEAYHIGASDVIKDDGIYKMWYNCGVGFKVINNRPEYQVHIKYATSQNGIDWKRHDIACIVPEYDDEIVVKPSVIKCGNVYKMWYSKRNIKNFRTDNKNSYRIGYAESNDGIKWERLDDELDFDISKEQNMWDSEMIAYSNVVLINDKLVMFYNGNGFGETGVGYAIYE